MPNDISNVLGQITLNLPEGGKKVFSNSQEAQKYFQENYGDGYSMRVSDNREFNGGELPELTVTAPSTKAVPKSDYASRFYSISDWNSLFGQTRVNGVKRALQKNPQALDNFKVAENALDFINIAGAGIPNRLSTTQNLRFIKDVYDGKRDSELVESWFGNRGLGSEEFARDHPWLHFGLNALGDGLGGYSTIRIFNSFQNPVTNPIKNIIELGMYSSRGTPNLLPILKSMPTEIKDNPKLFFRSLKYPFMSEGPAKTKLAEDVMNNFQYNGLWGIAPTTNVSNVGFNPIRAGLYDEFGIIEPYVRTVSPGDIHYDYAVNQRGNPNMKIIDSPYEDGVGYRKKYEPGKNYNVVDDIEMGDLTRKTGYSYDAAGHQVRLNPDGTFQHSDVFKFNPGDYINSHRSGLLNRIFEKPVLNILDKHFNDFIYQSKAVEPVNKTGFDFRK